ncbi:MAG: MerR family transcriptional regulator [Planctomycetota bacterium]
MAQRPSSKMLRIGDLARLGGVTTRTLRYYEDLDLIQPISRTSGRFRLYGSDQVQRLRSLLALKRAGLCLEEISECRRLARGDRPAREVAGELRARVTDKIKAVQKQITELQDSLGELNQSRRLLEVCCECDSPKMKLSAACIECWSQHCDSPLPAAIEALI